MFPDSAITDEGEFMNIALMTTIEPVKFQDAIKEKVWSDAMNEEIRAIERNKTWELVTLPIGKTPIAVKWVYKTKLKPDGSIAKHKARL